MNPEEIKRINVNKFDDLYDILDMQFGSVRETDDTVASFGELRNYSLSCRHRCRQYFYISVQYKDAKRRVDTDRQLFPTIDALRAILTDLSSQVVQLPIQSVNFLRNFGFTPFIGSRSVITINFHGVDVFFNLICLL